MDFMLKYPDQKQYFIVFGLGTYSALQLTNQNQIL